MGTMPTPREPQLAGQTVVLIADSAGLGLAARAEGADVRHRRRPTIRVAPERDNPDITAQQ
jgi:hypothetical protein